MDLSKELKEIASMSLVHVRKKSFCADTILAAQELAHDLAQLVEDTPTSTSASPGPGKSALSSATRFDDDDTFDSDTPLDLDVDYDESFSEGEGHSLGGSSERLSGRLSLSPGIISPILKSPLPALDDSAANSSTWPRHRQNRKKSTVHFSEDTAAATGMVRQKEPRSRLLAAAASTDWLDMTGCISDSGYGDDDASPFKTPASANADDELMIPDWRLETPVPELGDKTMNWKERESKIEDAIQWLRTEIRDMKKQDQILMCQFIQLRSDIHQLKCTGQKPKRRHQANSKIAGSCSDIVKSPKYFNKIDGSPSAPLSKFQSSMTLNCYSNNEPEQLGSLGGSREGCISEDELLDDDEDDEVTERTLLEPEYLPEYRTRTMSLLPTATVSPVHRKIARSRKSRNMSFSAGSAENTERGLAALVE